MVRGISDLIQGVAFFVPMRVLAVLIAIALIAAAPLWFETVRDKQIRGTIRRMVRADERERQDLAASVLRLAAGRPRRLGTVVRQAIHYDQRRLRDEALAALEATGAAELEVKHLRRMIQPAPVRFRDALEASIRVEKLLEEGLHVAAREQLQAALAAFPGDPELVALEARLQQIEAQQA